MAAPVPIPADAVLVELRPESLTFETREALSPGRTVVFQLVMEGQALPLAHPVRACVRLGEDRQGALFQVRVSLEDLNAPDRQIIALFINKGRGSPKLKPLSP